jgi:3'(2'), 5'-bisphosphate nucleotidase
MMEPSYHIAKLVELALLAGEAILDIYETDFAMRVKSDHSPVTEADEKAEAIILAGLYKLWPEIPVVAEEAANAGHIPTVTSMFFLVDPLDGTKEFVSRNGEFTVNISLIENGSPKFGVVYAPATNRIYWGEVGVGAAMAKVNEPWKSIQTRSLPEAGATVLASRSHRDAETDAYLAKQKVNEIIGAGSSLKFCTIAEGSADLYPRFGRTMEWDTAAGHAVLVAAGGKVLTIEGLPLTYGKVERGFDNPAFIASA